MLAMCMAFFDDDDDTSSFERLYYKYERKAFAIAYKILKNQYDTEDAVIDAFFNISKCFESIKGLPPEKMNSYIAITVKNAALSLYRKSEKFSMTVPYDDSICTEDLSGGSGEYAKLKDCLSQLSDTDQEILYLKYYLRMDYKAICAATRVSYTTAKKRLRIAKANLKKLMSED